MIKKCNFVLLGHLQVFDEPLSSLYSETNSKKLYLFVRLFNEDDQESYVLCDISPIMVVSYMDGKIGLDEIFSKNQTYYYEKKNEELAFSDFSFIENNKAVEFLKMDGLDDYFDKSLSYKSVPLKQYLCNTLR